MLADSLRILAIVVLSGAVYVNDGYAQRTVLGLDGSWDLEQGASDAPPERYTHRAPVPGLVDMAEPAFLEVGVQSDRREAFWYRRTFRVEGAIPETAILKIHKAKYGTTVFLNGRRIGKHLPSFTPALMNVRPYLRGDGAENELVVGVGAHREVLPEGQPSGWDFEKFRYIPGIYDSVELILSGTPAITNIQTVPVIESSLVRVVTELEAPAGSDSLMLYAEVVEDESGRRVGGDTVEVAVVPGRDRLLVEQQVALSPMQLWSPEDPFLYRVHVRTDGDEDETRFGMRSFRFDPETKRAYLNGRPYPLRGTNVTMLRFFEDSLRADLPWREEWVRALHRKMKAMNWNAARYCIGFPPDFWYDIADEEGILIQDEFPIWLLNDAPEHPVAEKIIPEYEDWMRERWNHPSVVIWDAQNESITDETGKAIRAVRHLDLSNRPWENGWAEPQSVSDAVESHPYLFSRGWQDDRKPFSLHEMVHVAPEPRLHPAQGPRPASIIVNEYGWLWLTRDGEPTSLTHHYYDQVLGEDASADDRRELYARHLAALTEFWRAHREAAGVLHFCFLGYSRSGEVPRPEGGATSDHFLDVAHLQLEPHFEEHVSDAFSPVGLMLDYWGESVPAGRTLSVRVYVVNDLHEPWEGDVQLYARSDNGSTPPALKRVRVEPVGREVLTIPVQMPDAGLEYELVAEIRNPDGEIVRSVRTLALE